MCLNRPLDLIIVNMLYLISVSGIQVMKTTGLTSYSGEVLYIAILLSAVLVLCLHDN